MVDTQTSAEVRDEDFKPKGAMAFFVGLLFLAGLIWFSIYFLMLSRS